MKTRVKCVSSVRGVGGVRQGPQGSSNPILHVELGGDHRSWP